MSNVHDRRSFLAGVLASPLLASALIKTASSKEVRQRPTLDIHTHLFGLGDAGTGCRISEVITDGAAFRYLMATLCLRVPGKTVDERYEEVLVEHVNGSGLTKAAVLGQDAVYDRHGNVDWDRTSFYVPNDYIFTVAARHSEIMIPCPSINPRQHHAWALVADDKSSFQIQHHGRDIIAEVIRVGCIQFFDGSDVFRGTVQFAFRKVARDTEAIGRLSDSFGFFEDTAL